MSTYTIWDIDNCLADDHWRQDRIDWSLQGDARYEVYNGLSIYDAVCSEHRKVFNLFRRLGAEPVFFSGRPMVMYDDTRHWLNLNLGLDKDFPYLIHLRSNGTIGQSPRECKKAMLESFLRANPNARILAAFDDIKAIIDMYREHDIPADVLAIHSDLTRAYAPSDLV